GSGPATLRTHIHAHHTPSRGGNACAMNFTVSMNCCPAMSAFTKSRPERSWRYLARASSASPEASIMRARSAAASGISIDHCNAALKDQHGVAFDGGHRCIDIYSDLALDLDHHPLDGDAHLVDLDAALAHLHQDVLHRLFGFIAQ